MTEELNSSKKREALNIITMVKEKRDGKIKGRVCANGCKQGQYIYHGMTYHHPQYS